MAIDSPNLPKRYDYEVEAMTEIEAKVRGAECAVTVAGDDAGPAKFRKQSREDKVTDCAGYAEATALEEAAK